MVWFFIVASLVAVALRGIISEAKQGRAFQAALVLTSVFLALFGLFSVICFLMAYFLGAVERAVVGKSDTPASPFSGWFVATANRSPQTCRCERLINVLSSNIWGAPAGNLCTQRLLASLLLVLFTFACPSTLWSQYSTTDALVTRSLRNRDVLRIQSTVDSPPGGNTGFVKVSITAPKPSPADRDLVVVFYVETYGNTNNSNVAYRLPVRLAEGKSGRNGAPLRGLRKSGIVGRRGFRRWPRY